MAIKIREVAGFSGSEGETAEAQLLYDIKKARSDSMGAVRAALLAFCPSVFEGLARDKWAWQEEEENLRIRATVTYNSRLPESTLRRGFDASGGTIRVYASSNTASFPRSDRTAPNFRGLIGIKDGDPEGVDITVPALKLNYRYKWPANVVNNAYVKAMAGLVGTCNSSSYDTYGAGELLFVGLSGEIVDDLPTEITYSFAASADVTGLTLGDITGVNKGGHDYLWVAYEENSDASAKKKIKVPLAAYVERVYRRTSWSPLGLGL
jgi:hypothetical protein